MKMCFICISIESQYILVFKSKAMLYSTKFLCRLLTVLDIIKLDVILNGLVIKYLIFSSRYRAGTAFAYTASAEHLIYSRLCHSF